MTPAPAAGVTCFGPNTEGGMERFTARTEDLAAAETRTEVIGHRSEDGRFVLGRYLLQRRLGAGGYGVVWVGGDEKLERAVAVKVIPREADGPAPVRAEREARVAARLNHPGIVSLYELGADDEAVYLVSELVHGRTFAELLKGGALSDRDVARIGIALCQALDHAHQKGVIHRDVKPQNVMVVAEPAAGAGFAKLTDFGVAHLAESDLTKTGDVVGTLAYMAPEQAEGERITEAVDAYALALTLYEGWTGSNPVKARGPAATARNLGRSLPRLRSRRRELPERLCQAIDAALDPRPDRRPSLEVLRHSLEHASAELSEEGGLVEPSTLKRFGLAERERRVREPIAVPSRAVAAVAAGLLVFLALDLLGPAPPVAPVAAPAAAALGRIARARRGARDLPGVQRPSIGARRGVRGLCRAAAARRPRPQLHARRHPRRHLGGGPRGGSPCHRWVAFSQRSVGGRTRVHPRGSAGRGAGGRGGPRAHAGTACDTLHCSLGCLRNERSTQPRGEARGLRRGGLQPRLQVTCAARRAGAQACQGDGGEPGGLDLAHICAERVRGLPLAGRSRAVLELRGGAQEGTLGLSARA